MLNLTDLAVGQFTQEELSQLAKSVGISKDLSRLDERLQIDLIRYYLVFFGPKEEGPLLSKFREGMKVGVEREIINLQSFEIPSCYGCFNDCKCLLHVQCGEKLINSLPHCYGVLYEEVECRSCIVKETCQTKGKEIPFEADEIFLFRPVNFMVNLLMALAYFKSLYYQMPLTVKVHPFNRAFNIKRVLRMYKHERWLPIDAFLMSGVKGQKPTQRNPVIFNQERNPIREI